MRSEGAHHFAQSAKYRFPKGKKSLVRRTNIASEPSDDISLARQRDRCSPFALQRSASLRAKREIDIRLRRSDIARCGEQRYLPSASDIAPPWRSSDMSASRTCRAAAGFTRSAGRSVWRWRAWRRPCALYSRIRRYRRRRCILRLFARQYPRGSSREALPHSFPQGHRRSAD